MNPAPRRARAALALVCTALLVGGCATVSGPSLPVGSPTPLVSPAAPISEPGTTPGAEPTVNPGTPAPSAGASDGVPPTSVSPPSASATGARPTPRPTTDLSGSNEGFITSFDSATGTVSVDVVYFMSGAEAISYAAAHRAYWDRLDCGGRPYAGGSTAGCYVDNDYFIVNDNPRIRELPLAATAKISLIPWPDCCETKPATRAGFASRVRAQGSPLLVRFAVSSAGTITAISEIYTP